MRAIEAGDYARASNILSNPMSSAVKNYSLVLMRSGSSEQRRLAATQVLAVMREYSLILQALEESGAEIGEQAKYACEALGLGYEPDVQSRLDALLATDEESVMNVTACRDLADSGRMSA